MSKAAKSTRRRGPTTAPLAGRRERQRHELADLAEAWERRRRADEDVRTIALALRAGGVTWSAIGRAVGMTPQGAMYRFRQPRPRP